jgi:cytoskeletal protein CcmA (bactofilin family)
MNTAAATLTLIVVLLVLLPVLPAWQEWRRPTDAAPLNVVRTYDGSVTHFAESFRTIMLDQIGSMVEGVESEPSHVAEGALKRGERYVVVGAAGHTFPLLPEEKSSQEATRVVIACGDMTIPSGYVLNQEVYGRQNLTVGARTACRAVLADGWIHFERGASVLRWAHASGQITGARDARLWGRVTSDTAIVLGLGSEFARLHAPQITTVGEGIPDRRSADWHASPRTALEAPGALINKDSERWVVKSDLDVPERTQHSGQLIATKDFTVGAGTLIDGSIKSRRRLTLEDHVEIKGAVIARKAIQIGQHAVIKGPIVGEDVVEIGAGSVIGSPDEPTTITAERIRLDAGVKVYGTVWAREHGQVTGTLVDSLAQLRV